MDDIHAVLHTPINKGHEAFPYLTYIIDNYHDLPSVIAFVHDHKDGYPRAWHNDNDYFSNVETLRTLNIDFLKQQGYVNLRCNDVPGCPDEIHTDREVPDPTHTVEVVMPYVWPLLFGDRDIPKVIAAACCAQFAVSRDQVRKRPLSDYEHYRNFLMETDLPDETSGRVFEYLWHIIFGRGSGVLS